MTRWTRRSGSVCTFPRCSSGPPSSISFTTTSTSLPLSYSGLVETPLVTTIHGFSSPRILPVFEKYNASSHYVSISDADRNPKLDYVATVHHGIALDEFELRTDSDGYLLFFGRIHREKGTAEAIEVARRSDRRLIIAGIVQDRAYFEREVAPHIDDDRVRYIGSVGPDKRAEVLGGAAALLHLIELRRAVRPEHGRGDGLRGSRDRDRPGLGSRSRGGRRDGIHRDRSRHSHCRGAAHP